MVGKWFHSYKDGQIIWQGQILSAETNGLYFVQLYSWLDGYPTDEELISIADMVDWKFYETDEEMRVAYNKYLERKQK